MASHYRARYNAIKPGCVSVCRVAIKRQEIAIVGVARAAETARYSSQSARHHVGCTRFASFAGAGRADVDDGEGEGLTVESEGSYLQRVVYE